jgi:hypothetical protein
LNEILNAIILSCPTIINDWFRAIYLCGKVIINTKFQEGANLLKVHCAHVWNYHNETHIINIC